MLTCMLYIIAWICWCSISMKSGSRRTTTFYRTSLKFPITKLVKMAFKMRSSMKLSTLTMTTYMIGSRDSSFTYGNSSELLLVMIGCLLKSTMKLYIWSLRMASSTYKERQTATTTPLESLAQSNIEWNAMLLITNISKYAYSHRW